MTDKSKAKETILFLPGMMCDARLFAPQIAALRDGFNCVVADLSTQDTITQMAQDAMDQVEGDLIVVGLSMGGIVAMEMMAIAPERIKALILMSTNPKSERAEVAAGREPHIKRVEEGALMSVMEEVYFPKYTATPDVPPEILRTCQDMARDMGQDVFVAQSKALQTRRDQSPFLAHYTCPTLVICGAYDRLCPVQTHEQLAHAIAGADLHILQKSGHLPNIEEAGTVNHLIEEFLS